MDDTPAIREIVDLSMPLKSLDTPVFPGAPQPLKAIIQTVDTDGYFSYLWSFSEHTSTHADAPVHMVDGGESIDKIPLSHFVGQGVVADLSGKPNQHQITEAEVKDGLAKAGFGKTSGRGMILLLRTGYSEKIRSPDWLLYPDLTRSACEFIVSMGFEAVGIDSPSPDRQPYTAHKTLLPGNVMVFENLANLDRVMGKRFIFVGAPLKLVDGTASPVRAIALVF